MASTTFFSTILKRALHKAPPPPAAPNLRSIAISLFPNPRSSFSSGPSISSTSPFEPEPEPALSAPYYEDLRTRILRLPKRSAAAALERWVGEGRKVAQSELRDIAKELRRSQRYKHALEIPEWMKTRQELSCQIALSNEN